MIYTALLDYCVIYDSRVGAALGLLARQFCIETKRADLPPGLAFAYGSPKEAQNPRNPKVRNPSTGALFSNDRVVRRTQAGHCDTPTKRTEHPD